MRTATPHRRIDRTTLIVEGGHPAHPREASIAQIRQVLVAAETDTGRGAYKRIARTTGLTVDQVRRILQYGNGVRAALRGWTR